MSEFSFFKNIPEMPYSGPYKIRHEYSDDTTKIIAECDTNRFTIEIDHADEIRVVEPVSWDGEDDDGIRGGVGGIQIKFEGTVEINEHFFIVGGIDSSFDCSEHFLSAFGSKGFGPTLFDELTSLIEAEIERIKKSPLPT